MRYWWVLGILGLTCCTYPKQTSASIVYYQGTCYTVLKESYACYRIRRCDGDDNVFFRVQQEYIVMNQGIPWDLYDANCGYIPYSSKDDVQEEYMTCNTTDINPPDAFCQKVNGIIAAVETIRKSQEEAEFKKKTETERNRAEQILGVK